MEFRLVSTGGRIRELTNGYLDGLAGSMSGYRGGD